MPSPVCIHASHRFARTKAHPHKDQVDALAKTRPEISYALPDDPFWRRTLIRAIETISGRNRILNTYRTWRRHYYEKSPDHIYAFFRLFRIRLETEARQWPPAPLTDAPIVLVANHPYGIVDGLAALALAEDLGRPYKVLLNKDLTCFPELVSRSLPVDFDETREAARNNIHTRKEALRYLQEGYTIIVFPAGGVATAHDVWGKAEELPWKVFPARMIIEAKAAVLPVFFEGQNSRLFHLASKFSLTLRLSLLVWEFRRLVGSACRVRIGDIVPFEALENKTGRQALTKELHDRVHTLAKPDAPAEDWLGAAVDEPQPAHASVRVGD